MTVILNILWFIFGGFISGFAWLAIGVLWCLSIVGIPVGLQCFKLAQLSAWPFGREVVHRESTGAFAMNLLWLIFGGVPIAAAELLTGLALCFTLIGIPWGLQHFKLARLALFPFGASIIRERF
ncbi:YccF domain-containing protein [Hutsoniella sourekii]